MAGIGLMELLVIAAIFFVLIGIPVAIIAVILFLMKGKRRGE